MLFSSITYLFYFLAAFLILYFAVPFKLKNTVLLVFSLLFYAWGGVKYAILMVTAILIGYIFGLLIEKFREKRKSVQYYVNEAYIMGAYVIVCSHSFFNFAVTYIKVLSQ